MTDLENPLLPAGHCQVCEWEMTTPAAERARQWGNGDAPRVIVKLIARKNRRRTR